MDAARDETDSDPTLAYTEANRVSWNAVAPKRTPEPAGFFADGGSTLDVFEVEALPDVRGRRLLHLGCGTGNDSFSWTVRGAHVTGVDISEAAVVIAQRQAAESGLDARFVAADVYALPEDLGTFDLVYVSWGVVCWLPDLDRFARIVAAHLQRGGSLLLAEHHPIWEILTVGAGRVHVTVDYFGRGQPTPHPGDDAKRPHGWTADEDFTAFLWPLSDVVMSIVRAGLRLEEFSEQSIPGLYEGLGPAAAWLPATYLIRASRT